MDTKRLTRAERENIVRDALRNLQQVYLDSAQRQADAQRVLLEAERDTGITRDQIDFSDKS